MVKIIGSVLLLVSAVALASVPSQRLEVTGNLPKTGSLTAQEIDGLKPEKASWTSHGKKYEVEGVRLDKVLAHFGFTPGPMGKDIAPADKRPGWKKVLVASAADGFQAIFSCAELAEDMGATKALLVWKVDGKPLAPEEGPFRIVVLTDKEPSRSIRGVAKLEVIDLRPRASSPATK